MDDKLPMKTVKFTSLENLYVYHIFHMEYRLASAHYTRVVDTSLFDTT